MDAQQIVLKLKPSQTRALASLISLLKNAASADIALDVNLVTGGRAFQKLSLLLSGAYRWVVTRSVRPSLSTPPWHRIPRSPDVAMKPYYQDPGQDARVVTISTRNA
ncbi:hypothetical protein DMW99_01195 [Pseudomonas chlororaphis]|nr:hypothetical protein C1Y36_16575 [Pseudomonas sp. FW306-2-2C-D06C]PYC42011.1 hypothetical protein DMW99_01195 [Pseudomonas chlororaphis]